MLKVGFMKRLRGCVVFLLCFTALSGPGVARDNARISIEKCYARRYRAAAVRYFFGMRYGRADDFQSFDVNGRPIDTEFFYAAWLNNLERVIECTWRGEIVKFRRVTPSIVVCEVEGSFRALLRNHTYTEKTNYLLEYVSEDVWENRDGQWVEIKSRMLQQEATTTPAS
jgi:hypothetical protein